MKALLVQVFGMSALVRYESCNLCLHTDPYTVVGKFPLFNFVTLLVLFC